MKTIHSYLMTFSLIGTSLFLSSCSKEEFAPTVEKELLSTMDNKVPGSTNPGITDPEPKDPTAEINIICANAAEHNKLEEITINYNFNETYGCDWSSGGNLSPVNGLVRARLTQEIKLNLPSDVRTICSMAIESSAQTMTYDDEIFLKLGDYILFASQDYSQKAIFPLSLTKDQDGDVRYIWELVLGQQYTWNLTSSFCAGISPNDPLFSQKCNFPPTQQTGQISIQLPDEVVQRIAVKAGMRPDEPVPSSLSLGFTATGDNDPTDCQHSDFEFDISYHVVKVDDTVGTDP